MADVYFEHHARENTCGALKSLSGRQEMSMGAIAVLFSDEAAQEVPSSLIQWLTRDDSPRPHFDYREGETGIYHISELLAEIDEHPEFAPPEDVIAWLREKSKDGRDLLLQITW